MAANSNSNSSEWKRDLRVGAVVCVVALCFLLFRLADILSYDLLFVFPTKAATDEVAIVYMDDESRLILDQPRDREWKRSVHAQLIEKVTPYGVKAIVFDVLFAGTNDPTANKALVEAAKRSKVVVAVRVALDKDDKIERTWRAESLPFPELEKVVSFGAVESPEKRQHYRDLHDLDIPSLAWRAAEQTLAQKPSRPQRERWLNYYVPGSIRGFSYHEITGSSAPSATLALALTNKVVFVGGKSGIGPGGMVGTDEHPTPHTLWTGVKTPGVDINATAYLNILHEEWNRRLWQPVEISLVILFAFLLPMLLRRLSPVRASIVSVAVAAAVFLLTGLLLHQYHYWFPWLVVSGVGVPCALACVLILKVQRTSVELPAGGTPAESPAPAAAGPARGADETMVINVKDFGVPQVPDHRLIRNIGAGGYGEVWLAESVLGSFRGVKIVYRKKFTEERPFEREFEGVRHFEPISRQHHGLVHILQVGRNRERGYFYCVMELAEDAVTGATIVPETYEPRTLSMEIKKRGAIPVAECVRLGLELSDALGFLHSQGLIHRDIKPGNIIYIRGRAKFADIGLVTQVGNDHTWVGTKDFFPPEGTGTLPADIFSLGKTLYCACSGLSVDRFPDRLTKTAAADDAQTLQRLNQIILKACENEPTLRYQTAADLQHDLRQLAQEV